MAFAALVLSCGVAAKAAAIRASNDPVKDERPITAKDREHWAWKPLTKVDAADLDAGARHGVSAPSGRLGCIGRGLALRRHRCRCGLGFEWADLHGVLLRDGP